MSWDKNTNNKSQINGMIAALSASNQPFTVEVKDKVIGLGLNDQYSPDGVTFYELCTLRFAGKIFTDIMQRTHDCDSDDTIVTIEVTEESLKTTPSVTVLDCEDYHPLEEVCSAAK